MTVSQFPTRFDPDFPDEPSTQAHLILQDLTPEFPSLSVKVMKGGGATYGLQNANPVLRWSLAYDGLMREEAQVLDDHYLMAQSQFQSFSFRHPRSKILYSNVRIESYDYPTHQHIDCQARNITLIKRPPQNDPGAILGENGDFMLSETGFHILQQN